MTIKFRVNNIKLVFIIILLCSVIQTSAQSIGTSQVSNKDIATQYINEIVNNKKLYLLKYVFDTGYVFHGMDSKDSYGMRDSALVSFLYGLFTAFPDLHYTIINAVAEGDLVALNLTGAGTHRAEFMGYAATQKTIAYKEMFVFKFLNNKITEAWGLVDLNGLKEQLGKP